MKTRTIIIGMAAAAVAVGLYLTDADAQRGRRGGRGGPGSQIEGLNLTEEQQAKLRSIRTDQTKQMTRLQADQRIAEIELQELLREADPSAKDVKSKVAAVNQARSKILETQTDFQVQTNKVFTPEQREQLQNNRGRRGQGRQGLGTRGNRRGGFGPNQGRGGRFGGRGNFRGPGGPPQGNQPNPQ